MSAGSPHRALGFALSPCPKARPIRQTKPALHIHCRDQHGTIGLHSTRQILPPSLVFDAFAICIKDFELVFVVTAEVIVERFAADCARDDLVSIATFEKNSSESWIIVGAGI